MEAQSYQEMNKPVVEWEEKMKDGIVAVFKRWPTIVLACDQEWAGAGTRNKINELLEEVFGILLNRKKKPMCPTEESDVSKLAQFLRTSLYERMNIELEDDSDAEVALWILRVLDSCRRSDYSIAEDLQKQAISEEKLVQEKLKKFVGECNEQLATEDDLAMEDIIMGCGDMEIDTIGEEEGNGSTMPSGNANGGSNNPHNSGNTSTNQEPEIDDDGFETVVRRKR